MLIGDFSYIGRKKMKFLPRVVALKYRLEFHFFLCSVGSLLILFHTAYGIGISLEMTGIRYILKQIKNQIKNYL